MPKIILHRYKNQMMTLPEIYHVHGEEYGNIVPYNTFQTRVNRDKKDILKSLTTPSRRYTKGGSDEWKRLSGK